MSSPEQTWISFTKQSGTIPPKEAAAVFSALKPIKPEFLTRGHGEWKGGDVNTGHPIGKKLHEMKWAGKTFRSTEDVDPIVAYDQDGQRKANLDWGQARLREIKCEDMATAAMIYDKFPIIDLFRYVSEDMVAGIMDSKEFNKDGTFYFYLTRLC
ncbi:hypothetical protein CDD81_7587 [Ophiocordyceps australis]|uniref:GXWXG domain-containing protein n=1 Tax=Ophiocordyceps australis TaxID=1399860 RepID=A0A2C5Y556_9HYPO|nr:hypothetical protein CDD81_7587 [Ophiocordyceps australis]